MRRVDSSIVGVAAPEEVAAVVNAQREAFAAREVRGGRATAPLEEATGAAEESISEAGRLRERGAEEGAADFVARICNNVNQLPSFIL